MFYSKTESLGLTTISKYEKAKKFRMAQSRQIFWVFVCLASMVKNADRVLMWFSHKMTINNSGRLAIQTCFVMFLVSIDYFEN